MSFDVQPHDETPSSPAALIASRDVVSEVGAALNSTGPSNAHIAQKAPPTSAPDPAAPGTKKRKPFKITKPLSRSLSTPHVRGVIMSESEAEKKRNKLGYQRISIACAHCRRRKIRCLVAEGDPHGRCQNCIRLKKDCAFYPVDQQGILDTKSQPSSAASGPSTGSAPSSSTPPDLHPTRSLEGRRDPSALPTVPSNVPDGFTGLAGLQISQGTPFVSQDDAPHSGRFDQRVFNQQPPYMRQAGPGLHQQTDPSSPWIGAGGFHDPASGAPPPAPDYSGPQYWNQPTLPTSRGYASFSYDPMSAPSASQRAHAYAMQRPDQMWSQHPQQPPMRSMSYGQIEGYPHSMDPYSNVHNQMHAPHMTRPMPQPLEVPNTSMMGPGPQSAPLRQDYQGYLNHQQQYAMQHGEFAPKLAVPSTDPGYAASYYQASPTLGSAHGSQHSPLNDSSSYAIHPSQPG